MMHKWFSFIICFCCFSFTQTEDNSLEFDILYNDKNIGHIYVTKETKAGKTDIDIISEVDYHSFLISYQRTTKLFTSFSNNELIYAKSEILKGEELESIGTTFKKEGYYLCKHTEEGEKRLSNSSITYSTSQLYYVEPKNITDVYSETYQAFSTIKKVKDGHYELHLPDNKVNEYFYESGELQKVVVHRTLFTITFKRRS